MNDKAKLKIADEVLREAWSAVASKLIMNSNQPLKHHVKELEAHVLKITGKMKGMTIEQSVYYVAGLISVTATLLEKMQEKPDDPVHKLFDPLVLRN